MTDQTSLYLYEFLYRGRAPASDQAPDYHVMLAQDVTDAFGRTNTSISDAMTPDQAKALGFDLAKIVAAVDAGTMTENFGLKSQLADAAAKAFALQTDLDTATANGTALKSKLDAATAASAGLASQLEAATSANVDLHSRLDAATANAADLQARLDEAAKAEVHATS